MPEISRYHTSLLCKLTYEEVFEYGGKLAAQVARIVDEEIRQGHERKIMKEKMEILEAERNRLAELVNTGFQKRDVECVVQGDYTTGKAYTMRLDTGEVINERVLRADEQQLGLGIEETDQVARDMHLRTPDGRVVGEPHSEAL